ncbi:MAG: exodeoxyribonuclease V subunit gamma [Zoogloeaceae bacterium]|jgi:exodeoxyribonuclease V gamma subunit|nr:exodeoxyribonuclease V subunit gamma [Zoogloeaceae bacterium]
MLTLHTSNRYEILRQRLLARLGEAPTDPFLFQEIIVPSAAIRQDVALEVARRRGVAAGLRFSFLAEWVWRNIARLIPEVARESPFAPERALWRFFRLFRDAEIATLPRLAAYLERADPVMRLELAGRVATLFETYLAYRPDVLEHWQAGRFCLAARLAEDTPEHRDEAWQMALWQRFTQELGTTRQHPASLFFATLDTLRDRGEGLPGLATPLHLFALFSIPPLYLDILAKLAEWTEIHLYLLNPCREYWQELVTQKRQKRLEAAGKAIYLDDRHPLLADWGRQTQALFTLTLERLSERATEDAEFQPACPENPANSPSAELPSAGPAGRLLQRFQDSILDLETPPPGAWPLAREDRSVEIHVAHALTRQLEILRDQLLARFEQDSTLLPGDVLVAFPDLGQAAPLIDAVFGDRRIPYAITGRALHENAAARLLLALMDLALPPARLPGSAVLALLQEPLVAHALALAEEDFECLAKILPEAGLRWGMDAEARKAAGLPADARHTWRDALARLLLGHALPADALPFAGIAPAGNLGGARGSILGVLWLVLERLEDWLRALAEARPPDAWRVLWQETLLTWLGEGREAETEEALRQVLAVLETLADAMREADAASPIPASVARAALEMALASRARGGTAGGAVTFAQLASLRGLPFRLVCLLGLEDGVFPRVERPLEFDLAARAPRPGDRQRRDEDRNVFLDMILSARQALYLSYTGRSQRDDTPLPPSIFVADLLEWLCRATGEAPERFVVRHPLQVFSPRYFHSGKKETRLVSFNASYAQIYQRLKEEAPAEPETLFGAPLAAPAEKRLALEGLRAFFRHPARSLLRERLGIRLPEACDDPGDEEPFLLAGLERYGLENRLLPFALQDASDLAALALAGTELPSGQTGKALLDLELHALTSFVRVLKPALAALSPEPLAFSFTWEDLALTGFLSGWSQEGLLRYRCANANAHDFVAAWLDHLCLNLLAPEGIARETRHIARNGVFRFLPVAAPEALLGDWLAAWREGMRTPLAFRPEREWFLEKQIRPPREPEEEDAYWRLARTACATPRNLDETLLPPLFAHLDVSGLTG